MSIEQSAGLSVSALSAEISIETETATANSRNSCPLMPGMKATGTNTESRTSVMARIGAVISPIAFLVGLGNRQIRLFLDDALDVLDHDDGVVDHDADRQHQRQQRNGVRGIADRQHDGEGADDRNGHGDQRDKRGAQFAEEQEHDDADQHEGFASVWITSTIVEFTNTVVSKNT